MRAGAAEFPVILGHEDFTGMRVTAEIFAVLQPRPWQRKDCIIEDSGGQLEIIAKENKGTHGLKTNTVSCFYALILQALRVRDHKASLIMLGLGHEAQHSVDGLKLPSRVMLLQLSLDFDINHWRWTDHIHQGKVHAQRHPSFKAEPEPPT